MMMLMFTMKIMEVMTMMMMMIMMIMMIPKNPIMMLGVITKMILAKVFTNYKSTSTELSSENFRYINVRAS